MVLEAIEIGSLLGGKKSVDDLDVKFEDYGFVIMDKSEYINAKNAVWMSDLIDKCNK